MESLQGIEDPVLPKGVIADLFHDNQKLTAEVKEGQKWKAEAEMATARPEVAEIGLSKKHKAHAAEIGMATARAEAAEAKAKRRSEMVREWQPQKVARIAPASSIPPYAGRANTSQAQI